MAKYNYDKTALRSLSVGPFLSEVKVREAEIAKADDSLPNPTYNANILASKLHPHFQCVKIASVIEHKGAKTFVMEPDASRGTTELAYFRAGQYISVALDINGSKVNKPYTLSSNPKDALGSVGNKYTITVKETPNGFAADYILANWTVGTQLTVSAPLGDFYYVGLRDAKNVIALAGGSGITPFLSMANAIADGIEDFNLTILYGSRAADSILLCDELNDAAARSGGKIKIVNVLSDDEGNTDPAFEHGFISADIIKKYAPADDFSIFVCGPKAMYNFLKGELVTLNLPKRRIRFELSGEYGSPVNDAAFPKDQIGREYSVKVLVRGETYDVKCKSEETLLNSLAAAGIRVPSDCRSGECGWCHSRLIKGDVYIPESADGRRMADKKFGWIHPCVSYPLSDIEIEVFPMLSKE